MKKEMGILLPIFSLPNKYGIGAFSKEAYEFVDFLEKTGQTYWQILPLNPTSYGDSPYQSPSAFAGNSYFIDIEELFLDELISKNDLDEQKRINKYIDYEDLYISRNKLLKKAYLKFDKNDKDFLKFCKKHEKWLLNYSLFMSIKDDNEGVSWEFWDNDLRHRKNISNLYIKYQDDILYYSFIQYYFFNQYNKLRKYANSKNIKIIGDMPIYVAYDSADVWVSPEYFDLDSDLKPVNVAGVPPDYFTPLGQLWGNPIYNWKVMEDEKYKWWVERIKFSLEMFDIVRIDHFRGFESYYTIKYGNVNAVCGEWVKGPSNKLFDVVNKELKNPNIIAEDLGYLDDDVILMLKKTGYPGMKIIEFSFDKTGKDFIKNHNENTIVYTGTHDNETLLQWYKSIDRDTKKIVKKEISHKFFNNINNLILYTLKSPAKIAIIPIYDYIGLGIEARINVPSTLGGNWIYRLDNNDINDRLIKKIIKFKKISNR